MNPPRIAFVGTSGNLGQPVTRQLLALGFPITAIARNVAKVQALFADLPLLKIAQSDLHDVKALTDILAGHQVLYLNLSVAQNSKNTNWQAEREGLNNLLTAAKAAGIQRVIYLSSIIHVNPKYSDWWVFRIKRQAVSSIKNCGIAYTIFYPSTFMETLDRIQMKGNKLLLAGESQVRNYYISGEDYAMTIAAAIRNWDLSANKDYFVQGPEPYTNREAAKQFIENYPNKQKLAVSWMPLGLMKFLGHLIAPLNYTHKILDSVQNYPEPFMSESTWRELYEPTINIPSYAAKKAVSA